MNEGFLASSPRAFLSSVIACVRVLSEMNSVAHTRSTISCLVTTSPTRSAKHTSTSITLSSSWVVESPRERRFSDGSTRYSPRRKGIPARSRVSTSMGMLRRVYVMSASCATEKENRT
jgi:hypothetical protein